MNSFRIQFEWMNIIIRCKLYYDLEHNKLYYDLEYNLLQWIDIKYKI